MEDSYAEPMQGITRQAEGNSSSIGPHHVTFDSAAPYHMSMGNPDNDNIAPSLDVHTVQNSLPEVRYGSHVGPLSSSHEIEEQWRTQKKLPPFKPDLTLPPLRSDMMSEELLGEPLLLPKIEAMRIPDINIDFAPPSPDSTLDPSVHSYDVNFLSTPDRSRSRNRIRAKTDPFSSSHDQSLATLDDPLAESLDQSRSRTTIFVPDRDYILGLADPSRPAPRAEGHSKRAQKHPATFQCNLCPKRFTRAYNLRSHLRLHTDERPFVCSVCGKGFARQHDRKRHESLHSGEKKFVCRGNLKTGDSWGCGRRFARADALGRHLRSEAGRVCMRPLLQEEFEEQPSLGSASSLVNEGGALTYASRIPAALLAQYPALAGLDAEFVNREDDSYQENPDGNDPYDAEASTDDHTYLYPDYQFLRKDNSIAEDQVSKSPYASAWPPMNIIGGNLSAVDRIQSVASPDQTIPSSKQGATHNIMDIASDSGYHSGLGTETASVCSMDSLGSSLGLPQNFLQEFIAFFGDTLIEKAGARQWGEYAVAHHTSDEIERHLNSLLKEYTVDLAARATRVAANSAPEETDSSPYHMLTGANNLIRRYRPKIARYFCDNAALPLSTLSLSERLQGLGQQLSLTERLGLFTKSSLCPKDPTESLDALADDEVEDLRDDEANLFTDLGPVRDLLVSNVTFHRLATELRRRLYRDETRTMSIVRKTILDGRQTPLKEARFDVNWSLSKFMQSQYDGKLPSVGSVVVLTGSVLRAQATTCAEYLQSTWPDTGHVLVGLLDACLAHNTTEFITLGKHFDSLSLEVGINFAPGGRSIIVAKADDERLIVEVAQQVAWIGTALCTSPHGDQPAYSNPSIHKQGSSSAFSLEFQCESLHPTETACWLPLFSGAVIASGFPIPDRADEMGLEVSLELLAALSGVRHAVEYEGGVLMKGFSHMFIPVRKQENRIQWHAISSQSPDTRLSYRDALAQCKARALSQEVSMSDLQTCRAILGWCSVAVSRLGSSAANYENIDYSGAKDADSGVRCAGGSVGFQQFGTAALDFRFGVKDGKCHFQRSGPYQRILSAAEKTPVVLYDTGEKRAWLVPATDVMLHMIQHRHWLDPFEVGEKRLKLDTDIAVTSSAKKVLLKNQSLPLSDDDNYTFKDAILNMWSLLEFLIDQNVTRDRNSSGTPVKGTLREYVHGFEFKAVVEERSPFREKQVVLNKTNGGWPLLVTDIDALVLLADGFEDIIVPANEGNGLCRTWQRMPKGYDYLATSTKILKELHDVAGCRLDRKFLTSSRLQWHQGTSVLFDACEGSRKCRCNRLQQILPRSAMGTIIRPKQIVDNGAVIFGQSMSMVQEFFSKPLTERIETPSIYSTPNVPLTPIAIRNDDEDAVSIEDDQLGRSGSDITVDSMPNSLSSCTTLSVQEERPDIRDPSANMAGSLCAKKRSRMAGISFEASERDEFGDVGGSECARKRSKSIQVSEPVHHLPLPQSYDPDDNHKRHDGSDSSIQMPNLSLNHEEISQFTSSIGVEGKDHQIRSVQSPYLAVRLAGTTSPRPLRRKEGFNLDSVQRGQANA